jgi:hypothetical protein
MRHIPYILVIVILSSCSIYKKQAWNCIQFDEGNMAFNHMIELIGKNQIDTNKIKAVKIYSYEFRKNEKIKDSTLIEYLNLDYFSTFKDHTTYEIKYDSLGRDFERYATRVETGTTHLNYRKTYDENSNLKEWTVFNRDGQINFKTYYYYDSLHHLVREEKHYGYFLYEQPKLEKLTTYEYQDSTLSRKIQWNDYLDNKGFDSKLIQEYDYKSRLINYKSETIENDSITSFWGIKSFYDNKGKLIKEHHYGSDNINTKTNYKYDSDGLPIEVFSMNIDPQEPSRLIRYFYEGQRKTTHNSI